MAENIRIDKGTDALLHVDVQTAFMEDHLWSRRLLSAGGLPVPHGHWIIPMVRRVNRQFADRRRYATLDRHPDGHISWVTSYTGLAPYHELSLAEAEGWTESDGRIVSAEFTLDQLRDYLRRTAGNVQTIWPAHGPIGTEEAELHPALQGRGFRHVLVKGTDPRCDSYSGVKDNIGRPTGLADLFRRDGVARVFVDGLAYTHCVGWTALDLAAEGFTVFLMKDATKPVPIPGLEAAMDAQLAEAGVRVISALDPCAR